MISCTTITVAQVTDPTDGYTARFEGPDAETVLHMAANPGLWPVWRELQCDFFHGDGHRVVLAKRKVHVAVSPLGLSLEVDPDCRHLSDPIRVPISFESMVDRMEDGDLTPEEREDVANTLRCLRERLA